METVKCLLEGKLGNDVVEFKDMGCYVEVRVDNLTLVYNKGYKDYKKITDIILRLYNANLDRDLLVVPPNLLRPSQEFNTVNTNSFNHYLQKYMKWGSSVEDAILVCEVNDEYVIVDGHSRWLACFATNNFVYAIKCDLNDCSQVEMEEYVKFLKEKMSVDL